MSRIADLPRRNWRDGVEHLVKDLTDALKTPNGTMTLKPIQSAILYDLAYCPGCWGSASVGSGKTLCAALAKNVTLATRVLIVIPASLEKTLLNEFAKLRHHFKIGDQFQIRSYSWLGRENNAEYLEKFSPELIICDEVHKLKRKDVSAVGRRFSRFFASPKGAQCKLLALSGSMMRKGFRDFSHILYWCLRDQAPVPKSEIQREAWATLLDDGTHNPNTLRMFNAAMCSAATSVKEARAVFQDRLRCTPGVIVSDDHYKGVALTIKPIEIPPPEEMNEDWRILREEWTLPDDWDLADAKFEVWAKAMEFSLGFYYQCDPRPPEEWAAARKAWNRFCRGVIEDSHCYDSAAQIVSACENGDLDVGPWQRWQGIRDTFKPSSKPVWLSTHALEAAESWGLKKMRRGGGIIWVDHTAFGHELSKRTGWAYFGKKGRDRKGRHIEDKEVADKVVILSRWAGQEGMNLQKWHQNLQTAPPGASLDWEQFVARTHRTGQTKDVTCDYFVACTEHLNAIRKAFWLGSATVELLGQPVKVLTAEFIPPDKKTRTHWAFKNTTGDE